MAEEIKEDVVEVQKSKGKNKTGMVEVEKATLDKILSRMEMLEEAADKGRLERVRALRNTDKILKKVNLSTYNGRIIIGWRSIKDDVFFDREGKMHEDQVVELYFYNGKTNKEGQPLPEAELNIQSFSRLLKRISCEVIEESKDKNGNINLTVTTPDNQEIKIDLNFTNAS